MSIAYIDPGNIESDLQVGAVTQYKVCVGVWVCVWVCVSVWYVCMCVSNIVQIP